MITPRLRVGLLATHPIQYYCPWYRVLATEVDLEVFFSHRQTPEGQAAAGFGVQFDWDVPLLDGYRHTFLENVAKHPDVGTFWGCNTPALAGIIREKRFDAFIVHGWSTQSYWQAIIACWRSGTPVLVRGDSNLQTPRAWWWRAAKRPVFRSFIPRFDGYLVVGARARDYLLSYGADPRKCFDTPHAVDNQFFSSRAGAARDDRDRIRRDLGLKEDAIVFLFAGRFVDRKRPDLFVTSISAAGRKVEGIAGLMVGDGPDRKSIEAAAAASDAPIRFAGFLNQTEMARIYAACDVLVVPSTWETWGLVVNEAMACGLPAIVSQGVACAGDLVLPGVTGDVFETGQADHLTEQMVKIASDGAYRRRLGANASRHVQKFDVTAAAKGTVLALEEIVSRQGRRTTAHTARPASTQP